MKDKHYLHRVAIVRLVDSLFYESGNARWCHSRCCSLITESLCGIGTSTHRNYLHFDRPELLAEVQLPAALQELLRLYVLVIKRYPTARTSDLLQALYRMMAIVLERSDRRGSDPDAAIEWPRGISMELLSEK